MNYREELFEADAHKKKYLEGLEYTLRILEEDTVAKRDLYLKHLFLVPDKHRDDLCKKLGWPLGVSRPSKPPEVTAEHLFEDGRVVCQRLSIKIFGEFYATGLYFRQKTKEKRPLAVIQHGGIGSCELIAGFYGSTANYNDMLERVLARGADVFAPQLLIWNQQDHPISYDRTLLDARLKRVGSSLAALEIFALMRSLDYFEAMDGVSAIGMAGLSYGGFYTLYTAAIDTRIRAAVVCSHFFSREAIPNADRSWADSAVLFDDATVAALIYPRSLSICAGKGDPLFPFCETEAEWERLCRLCHRHEIDTEWVTFTPFDGAHEFPKDEQVLDRFFEELAKPVPKVGVGGKREE